MTRPFTPGYRIPPDLLLRAYAMGVFPMAERSDDPEVFWVRPETRGVIPLNDFHVPRRLARTMRQNPYRIARDSDFSGVMDGCAESRPGRTSTWINQPIREAYTALFERGHCHTVEAWRGENLVGGLYGVSFGRAFFGESMFSREADTSKICLVHLVGHLRTRGFVLLDTQFTTAHLKRFGAIDMPRAKYERILEEAVRGEAQF